MGKLLYLVIHCTDTPAGREVSADEIRRWHTAPRPRGRGWKQVGYTDMIHLDGRVERLVGNNEDDNVDPWEVTNGASGYNGISRHIVYVGGGRGTDTRTPAQLKAMADYVRAFHAKHPEVKIIGHAEISNKKCPGFNVGQWLTSIGIKQ